jgi:hypothetical protein
MLLAAGWLNVSVERVDDSSVGTGAFGAQKYAERTDGRSQPGMLDSSSPELGHVGFDPRPWLLGATAPATASAGDRVPRGLRAIVNRTIPATIASPSDTKTRNNAPGPEPVGCVAGDVPPLPDPPAPPNAKIAKGVGEAATAGLWIGAGVPAGLDVADAGRCVGRGVGAGGGFGLGVMRGVGVGTGVGVGFGLGFGLCVPAASASTSGG